MRDILLVVILVLGISACAEPRQPPVVVRADSSGIEIVTSTPSGDVSAPVWRLSRRAVLELGELDGPEEFTFGTIRAVGRLGDGRIYVGDEQAHLVRVFSESGDYETFFGGEGEGPGELQWFLTVERYRGDSIFVYDYSQRAVSVFDADLEFGRRVQNPLQTGNYWITGALPDGRFLATSPGRSRFPGETGLFADSSFIVLVDADGESADTIGGYRAKVVRLDPQSRPESAFLQPRGGAFVLGDNIAWVDGERFEFIVATPSGEPIRVVRKADDPVPVTADLRNEFRRSFLDLAGQNPEAPQERIRRMLDEGHYPEALPALSPELHADALGYIWVARYHFDGEVAAEWEVFDSTGVWVGRVVTPENFQVHQIGVSEIIGVGRGDFDVPYVQVYGLRRD